MKTIGVTSNLTREKKREIPMNKMIVSQKPSFLSRFVKDERGGDVITSLVVIALLVGVAIVVFRILQPAGTTAAQTIGDKMNQAVQGAGN